MLTKVKERVFCDNLRVKTYVYTTGVIYCCVIVSSGVFFKCFIIIGYWLSFSSMAVLLYISTSADHVDCFVSLSFNCIVSSSPL